MERKMNDLVDRFRKGVTLKESEMAALYKESKDLFFNTDKTLLTDDEFDALKAQLKAVNPKNPALDIVGAPVRDATRKVTLPYWMGSLDKIRDDEKAIQRWTSKYPGDVIVSDKLDGNSAMFVRTASADSLYTRGDGSVGQNCSELLQYIHGIPKAPAANPCIVRGEVLLSKRAWQTLKHKGANARNVTAGAMNAKTPDPEIAKALEFVAYELLEPKGMTPSDGLELMSKAGFSVVHHRVWKENELTMVNLSTELVQRRENSPYEVDGIVILHNIAGHRTVKNKNPKHAFAFKSVVTHDEAEVIVTDVEWNISKDGYIKPTVVFEPVSLNGVVIRRATGFNASFIHSNNIGIGARVSIIRSGDVIPKIMKVVRPSTLPSMPPDGTWEWVTGTDGQKVDIRAIGEDAKGAAALSALEHFVRTMDISFIGRGTLEKLAANGIHDISGLMRLTASELQKMDGIGPKNAEKIANSITLVKSSGICETWMVASNLFGRGVGSSKIKAITEAYPESLEGKVVPREKRTNKVEGVGAKVVDQFFDTLPKFMALMRDVGVPCIKPAPSQTMQPTSKSEQSERIMAGAIVVFTGFRDKDLEASVAAAGGEVAASITKKTTLVVAKDPNEDSTKLKKARELGIEVIGLQQFKVKMKL